MSHSPWGCGSAIRVVSVVAFAVQAPKTYIKESYFRGYFHREVVTVRYTRFERARIIGARALQISMGAPVLVDVPDDLIDPIEISITEYDEGVIPMTVKRDG